MARGWSGIVAMLATAAGVTLGTAAGVTRVPIDDNAQGFAYCTSDGVAKGFVEVDVIISPDGLWTIAHEIKHKRDLEARGCSHYADIQRDRRQRLRLEIDAYCVSIKVAQQSPRNWSEDRAVAEMSSRLAYAYNFGLNVLQADSILREECRVFLSPR